MFPATLCLSDLAETDHLDSARVNCWQVWQEFHLKALGESPPWKHCHSWAIPPRSLVSPSGSQAGLCPDPAVPFLSHLPSPFWSLTPPRGPEVSGCSGQRPLSSGPAALCPKLHRLTPESKLTPPRQHLTLRPHIVPHCTQTKGTPHIFLSAGSLRCPRPASKEDGPSTGDRWERGEQRGRSHLTLKNVSTCVT